MATRLLSGTKSWSDELEGKRLEGPRQVLGWPCRGRQGAGPLAEYHENGYLL
jgi:hypothetical protein